MRVCGIVCFKPLCLPINIHARIPKPLNNVGSDQVAKGIQRRCFYTFVSSFTNSVNTMVYCFVHLQRGIPLFRSDRYSPLPAVMMKVKSQHFQLIRQDRICEVRQVDLKLID